MVKKRIFLILATKKHFPRQKKNAVQTPHGIRFSFISLAATGR